MKTIRPSKSAVVSDEAAAGQGDVEGSDSIVGVTSRAGDGHWILRDNTKAGQLGRLCDFGVSRVPHHDRRQTKERHERVCLAR